MPATFAFYRAPGDWRDRVIRAATGHPYSHAELLSGPPINGEAICISASKRDGSRVRIKRIRFKTGHWDFITVPSLDADECWDRVLPHLGEPYDTWGAVLTVTPWARARPGRWFCSETLGLAAGLHEPYRHHPGSLAVTFLTELGGTRVRQPSLGGAAHLAGETI